MPHNLHRHPFYIQYRQEQLEQDFFLEEDVIEPRMKSSDPAGRADFQSLQEDWTVLNATISTPISYDEETGMVQTAVRAIVQHPIANIVAKNHVVGLSSTLVIATGALHEMVDCVQLEWTHHATQSTEGLALLSLGHFLHYGRETVRQLVEFQHREAKEKVVLGRNNQDS
ncbi:hypothetical protein IV203_029188 [Nitzschia inconspicua]|uniref:Uncharacterized protein n=1 Tax=Nitzschia inconspicua TaxID=303405 RepID=A0A9K3LQ91_9STRA|nr:hypothetical protein IV203_029188 [Nitzschia inconspicua]